MCCTQTKPTLILVEALMEDAIVIIVAGEAGGTTGCPSGNTNNMRQYNGHTGLD